MRLVDIDLPVALVIFLFGMLTSLFETVELQNIDNDS